MSRYRKRRNYSGRSRRSSGGELFEAILWILAAFMVISLVPLLFSLGGPGGNRPTEPPNSVTDPPVDPTDPPAPLLEEGYLLYQLDADGSKKYLNIRDSSVGGSLKSNPSDACLYRWSAEVNTFFVADPDINRFLGVAPDSEDPVFSTYAYSSAYVFARFMSSATGNFVESNECPLVEDEVYWLVVDSPTGGLLYYTGTAGAGRFNGSRDSAYAAEVYVEYVTREVVS